tara:strand:+ start:649 stop:1722 length:1074 start_codon:yes stop_codon:yes gene_type:complete
MKNLKLVLVLLLSVGTLYASSIETPEGINNVRYNGRAYIFIEGGVEFSVFADGQFDFLYLGKQNNNSVFVNTPSVFVSFNAGHDYEAYLQYDDYGAIIQIEDVPVFYDVYGRIIQAGEVEINYINRAISRVGSLQIYYNRYGDYAYCIGYINSYNRFYTYRPWHRYYQRPIYTNCIVWDIPYRRYYTPIRYSYNVHLRYYNNRTNNTYVNGRREFISPGSRIHYRNGRTALNTRYKRGRKNTMVTRYGTKTRIAKATNTNRVRNSRAYQNNTNTSSVTNTTRTRTRPRVSNTRVVSNTSRNRTAIARVSNRTVTTTPKPKRKTSIRNVTTNPRTNTVAQSTSRKTTVARKTSRKRRL